jgi:5-methylcytosine-specific restriction protein A
LGGSDDDQNIRCLCADCHQARTAEQFGRRMTIPTGRDGWPIG